MVWFPLKPVSTGLCMNFHSGFVRGPAALSGPARLSLPCSISCEAVMQFTGMSDFARTGC